MLEADAIRATLSGVAARAGGAADAFAESTTLGCAVCDGEGGRDVQSRVRRGIGLRTIAARGITHVHSGDLSEAGLTALAAALTGSEPAEISARSGGAHADDDGPLGAAMADVAAEAVGALAVGGEAGLSGRAFVRTVRQRILAADSEGRLVRDEREYWALRIDAVARAGRKVRHSRRMVGAATLEELARDGRHRELAREAAGAALVRTEAVPGPSGETAVIFAPGRPGTLIHETVGHGLEADHTAHPASAYHGLLGEAVGASCLTVVDDPAPPGEPPIYSVDDEGTAAESTVLIEDGRLRTYLYDRRTALAHGRRSNGHARRLDYSHPPLPRTSATYVLPGDHSAEEILADTPRGILVLSIGGGDTDMGSGRFSLRVDEGYLIEDGRLTAPIIGATISGQALDVLRSIDRIGDDLEFVNLCLVCNKLEQFPLLITVGQPTLRVPRLHVWGSGG